MLDKITDPAKMEAERYQQWEDQGLFVANQPDNQDKPPFTIMIPPPNVTGSLHIGHALNNSLQDVLTRWQRMKGHDCLWLPGTDHAGIATQMVVERKLEADGKPSRKELGREAFLKQVWEWKAHSGGQIIRQLRRLGASCDWSRERFTMDEGLSSCVTKVFVTLHKQGLIYRDQKLVNWDPAFETAISDLEVNPTEIKGKLYHIAYDVDGNEGESIVVATTRPETLFGDMAVAVHPDDPRYQHLIGKYCRLPLSGRLIPILADEHADPEQGSGAVKITPAHDFNDFEVGRRHNLTLLNILTPSAHLNDEVPEAYRGMERFKAREKTVADLEAQGKLIKIEAIRHSVPYGDRSAVPIEPYLTDQWYVDAHTLAQPAIKAVREGKTKIVPENWSKTYYNWMENIQPWCVSRQLWWGHRIPAWYGPDGMVFVEENEAAAYQAAAKYYQSKPEILALIAENKGLTRDEDVLDTWFSSALWPFSTLGWPQQTADFEKFYPNTILVTAFDILFFWVARMMMMGLHFTGEVPFKTVYVHALVLDAEGKKMSKSKGNVIDPLASIDDYGADSLRFTLLAQASSGRNVRISDDLLKNSRNFITKLWNAARFCEMNGIMIPTDFDPQQVNDPLGQWLVYEVSRLRQKQDQHLNDYRFADAAMALYHFIYGTFCDWHLEFAKPVFASSDEAQAQSIRKVTGWALGEMLKLFHPFCPFVTETLWQHLYEDQEHKKALAVTAWPKAFDVPNYETAWQHIDWMRALITAIRGVKAELKVPVSTKVTLNMGGVSADIAALIDSESQLIKRLARVETISDRPAAAEAGTALFQVGTEKLAIPLHGLIDFAKEHARLEKERLGLEKELETIQTRLNNQGFIAKAPEEVIEELKARLDVGNARLNDLNTALEMLS
ncbi:MAG: valine--tRNA ligase [Alphaproteobacteria bacterium]